MTKATWTQEQTILATAFMFGALLDRSKSFDTVSLPFCFFRTIPFDGGGMNSASLVGRHLRVLTQH